MRIIQLAALALSLGILLPCTLSAQNKPKAIQLRFVAFPKKLDIEPLELLVGKETLEIATPGHEFSPSYKVPPLSSIVVGKTVQGQDGKPTFQIYGKGQGIAASEQIILLIRKGNQPSDGFVVMPMDARSTNFPGGSFLFVNASTKNVGCEIGDKAFAVKPGQQKLAKPKPTHQGGVCQATFTYEREDKSAKKFYDTRWTANEAYRTMVFFYDLKGKVGVSPVIDIKAYEGNPTPP